MIIMKGTTTSVTFAILFIPPITTRATNNATTTALITTDHV